MGVCCLTNNIGEHEGRVKMKGLHKIFLPFVSLASLVVKNS
jgi:hypothetical protein